MNRRGGEQFEAGAGFPDMNRIGALDWSEKLWHRFLKMVPENFLWYHLFVLNRTKDEQNKIER